MRGRTRAVGAALVLVGILVAVALVASSAGAEGGEGPVTVKVGFEPPVEFQSGVSPKRLPAGNAMTTKLQLGFDVTSPFGGVPPGIVTTRIGLDRSLDLEPTGLPACRKPALESGDESDPSGPVDCDKRDLVGRVRVQVVVDYAETSPVNIRAEGEVYSGVSHDGGVNLLMRVPFPSPLNEVRWFLARVRPVSEGRIGSAMTIKVPELVQNAGSLDRLFLDLGRNFVRDGERVAYVAARCDGGKLIASQSTRLTDGTEGHSDVVRACTRRPA